MTNNQPRFLSLFTGIGGFDVGFESAGMTCIGQCEIDRWANMVLRYHWPDTKRINDVKEINKSTFDVRPDVICGGFPCQDLSVAGKRAGLAGGRSGLWFEYHRIVALLKPEWVVVENVPGLLSSNESKDFAILIRGLEKLGYMGIWKTFDSQYFGVAQRRRRVFIIGYLRGKCRSEILFESESLSGDPAEGRKKGQGLAADVAPCLAGSGRGTERAGESRGQDPVVGVVDPIACNAGPGSHDAGNFHCNQGVDAGHIIPVVARSLSARNDGSPCIDRRPEIIAFSTKLHNTKSNQSGKFYKEYIPALEANSPSPAVAFTERTRKEGRNFEYQEELAYALTNPGSGGRPHSRSIAGRFGVRRLTPKECERLQGFKDDWTQWGIDESGNKVKISDTQRYKQLGNAVTINVAEWIGHQIIGELNK